MRTISLVPSLSLPPELLFFILAGQSNMSGRGLLAELNASVAFPNASRVKNFTNAWTFVQAAEPVDSAAGQIDTVSSDVSPAAAVGPSMAFGNHMADLVPNDIGLIPCAKGGTGLNSTLYNRSTSRSTLYGSLIARTQAAAQYGRIAGMIQWIGEGDSTTESTALNYASRQAEFIANVREDLGLPNLPVVVTELGPNSYAYSDIVREAQRNVSDLSDYATYVSAQDLTLKPGDDVHVDTASQLIHGRRLADAMRGLLGG